MKLFCESLYMIIITLRSLWITAFHQFMTFNKVLPDKWQTLRYVHGRRNNSGTSELKSTHEIKDKNIQNPLNAQEKLIHFQGRQLTNSFCPPSVKGSTLKENNLLLMDLHSFLLV